MRLLALLATLLLVTFDTQAQDTREASITLRSLLVALERVLPGRIDYDSVQGKASGPFRFRNLRYRDGDLLVAFSALEFDWTPTALLRRTVHIRRLRATDVVVRLPAAEPVEPAQPGTVVLPDIRLPLRFRLEDIAVERISVRPDEAPEPIVLDSLELQAEFTRQGVSVTRLELRSPQADLYLQGRVDPVGNYPLDTQIEWQWRSSGLGALSGSGKMSGDLEELEVSHEIDGLVDATLHGRLERILSAPAWSLEARLDAVNLGHRVAELAETRFAGTIDTEGSLSAYTARADLTVVPAADAQALDLSLALAGAPQRIEVESLRLSSRETPMQLLLDGELHPDTLEISLQGRWNEIPWPLAGEPLVVAHSGEVSVEGTAQAYTADLRGDIFTPQSGLIRLESEITGNDHAVTVEGLHLQIPATGSHVQAQGGVSFADFAFDLGMSWQDAVYPPVGEPRVRSARGKLQAHGTPADYDFELRTALTGDGIPPGDWLAVGQGTQTGVRLTRLGGVILGGSVRARGEAKWSPATAWEAQLLVDSIDPGEQWPKWPGRVSLQAELEGLLQEDGLHAVVDLVDLDGSLRGQALRGGGRVAINGDAFAIDALEVSYGGARIAAGGGINRQWDLHWALSAPRLQETLPDASGTLRGRGAISGARAQPHITAQLAGAGLSYQGRSIRSLALDADVDMSESLPSQLELALSGISLGRQSLQQIKLQVSGKPSLQEIEFSIESPTDALRMQVRGGLGTDAWKGQLEQVDLLGRGYGAWTLEKPAALVFAANKSTWQQTCLIDPPSRLCLGGSASSGLGSHASLQAKDVPLERFYGLMPPGVFVRSRLDADIEGGTLANGELYGTVDLNLAAGNVDLTTDTGRLTLPLTGGSIRAKATGDTLRGAMSMELENTASTDIELEINRFTSEPTVQARLQADVQNLAVVSAIVPDLQAVSGEVNADLRARGPLQRPNIDGTVRLRNAAADVPLIGLQVQDLHLEANARGDDQITISGAVRSGDGELRIDGQIEPFVPRAELALAGERFQLANTEEFRLVANADLQVRLEGTDVAIEGELVVPTARIAPARFRGGVRASRDVVVIEEEPGETLASSGNLAARVKVVLGEAVNVEAAGFKARLNGKLLVEQNPGQATRGSGRIAILDGRYKAYGQDLTVERGLLLFAGGPIDNPGLDFRAVRRVKRVTAGVRVLGTAADPRLSLFSEPPLPDTSVLSYLILGRAPDGRSSGESSMLLQAATALGTAGGNTAGVQIAERVGLNTLTFQSAERASQEEGGETEETTNLVLGKYLTRDIYVSYGVGVFDTISEYLLRYQLTDQLAVETRTGVASGGDIIYSIERD